MTLKKEAEKSPEETPIRKRRVGTPSYTAEQKAQAVLAVWTDRVKPSEVMRTMKISYMTLHHWQVRAMEGMLQALESRVNLQDGAALSPRLRNLLAKRAAVVPKDLTGRLEQIQALGEEAKPQ